MGVKGPWHILSEKAGEWDNYIGVPRDEASIEIGKAKERLHIADIAELRPVKNHLDLTPVHPETIRGTVIPKELHCKAVHESFANQAKK